VAVIVTLLGDCGLAALFASDDRSGESRAVISTRPYLPPLNVEPAECDADTNLTLRSRCEVSRRSALSISRSRWPACAATQRRRRPWHRRTL
jgi:hypothetical protein